MNKIVFRVLLPVVIVVLAITSFKLGVTVAAKPDLGEEPVSILLFHCIGLFGFGAKDFGMPNGGPVVLQWLLFFMYFLAPLVSLSALAEFMYFFSKPVLPLLLFRGNHFVVIGNGRIGKAAVEQIQKKFEKTRVVIIDKNIEKESSGLQVFKNNRILIKADVLNGQILEKVNINKAKGVFILTDNEWVNLSVYYKTYEKIKLPSHRIYVRLSSIDIIHFLQNKESNTDWCPNHLFFNIHTAASHQLFSEYQNSGPLKELKSKIVEWTKNPIKQFVLIGFGRFGQSFLSEFQEKKLLQEAKITIIDIDATNAWRNYTNDHKNAQAINPILVHSKMEALKESEAALKSDFLNETIVVFCSNDETVNIKTAANFHKMFDKNHSMKYILRIREKGFFPEHLLEAVVGKNCIQIPTYEWMKYFFEEQYSKWN